MKKVDKDEVNDEESDLMFGYANNGQDTTKLDLINDYLPERTDYSAKTVLSEEHPEIMAAIENLTDLYPEVEHMEDTLVNFVLAFEKRQISVKGRSRQEFLDILAGLSGGNARDFNEREQTIKQMLTPKNGDDDE